MPTRKTSAPVVFVVITQWVICIRVGRTGMAEEKHGRRRSLQFVSFVAVVVLATVLGLALLVSIFQRKQEARNPFFRVVELTDDTVDPGVWGKNFPLQYDDYLKTTDQVRTRYGGSEAEPRTPTQADPRSIVAQSRLDRKSVV